MLSIPHNMRENPRGCPMGDPGGKFRGQASMARKEMTLESGATRRRIAVAVSLSEFKASKSPLGGGLEV